MLRRSRDEQRVLLVPVAFEPPRPSIGHSRAQASRVRIAQSNQKPVESKACRGLAQQSHRSDRVQEQSTTAILTVLDCKHKSEMPHMLPPIKSVPRANSAPSKPCPPPAPVKPAQAKDPGPCSPRRQRLWRAQIESLECYIADLRCAAPSDDVDKELSRMLAKHKEYSAHLRTESSNLHSEGFFQIIIQKGNQTRVTALDPNGNLTYSIKHS